MENIVIVVNNRNTAMQLASYLKRAGIRCKIKNTPRELSVSCGLSIYLLNGDINLVRQIILGYKLISQVKIYKIISNGVIKKYIPI